jgi:dolichol-phosphate mannosyltransferase
MNSRAKFHNGRISEMPIVFIDRRVGKSKINKGIIWEALWLVWKIRFSTEREK